MQYAIEWDVVSILVFVCVLLIDFERVPERVRPFVGFTSYMMYVLLSCVLLFWSTRPSSESQSQGDSLECSILYRFPLRERGRVAESPSVVLGCSRRDSRVVEDLARWCERVTPAWPVGSVAWRVLGMLSYLAFSLTTRDKLVFSPRAWYLAVRVAMPRMRRTKVTVRSEGSCLGS